MMRCHNSCTQIFFSWALLVVMTLPAGAVSQLRLYQKIPAFDLPALDPQVGRVSSNSLVGSPAVIVFGELYHANTLAALKELERLRQKLSVTEGGGGPDWPVTLICAQDVPSPLLRAEQAKNEIKATVLHDKKRAAFGAYGVTVLPSFVVVDPQGRVCTAVSGYPLDLTDMMTSALLLAQGRLTRQQFEDAAREDSNAAEPDEARLQVERLTGLARQLLRRGYASLALERFKKVLQLDGDYFPAEIGAARCLIKLGRLPEAEVVLQGVLARDKQNVEATRAMAWIEIMRGGDELNSAIHRLDLILALHHHDPEAHYLKGLIYETQGKTDKALSQYKEAAEALLDVQKKR